MKQSNEKKVIFQFFPSWDFEKLELWLNEMAAEGWALTHFRWNFYHFERTEPGEYIIRLEYHVEADDYPSFIKGTGAELVGVTSGMCSVFRRKSELGDFELLQDLDARIEHLTKASRRYWLPAAFCLITGPKSIYDTIASGLSTNQRPAAIAVFAAMGALIYLAGIYLIYGIGRIHGKREELKKERQLHE